MQHLRKHGCELLREGSRHSIWVNRSNRRKSAVPRHTEIQDLMAQKICRDLDVPKP